MYLPLLFHKLLFVFQAYNFLSYCELPLVYDNAFAFIGVKVYVLFTAYVGKALD